MGNVSFLVRPMAYVDDTGGTATPPDPDYSDYYDVGEAVSLHATANVISKSGTSPTLDITCYTSVDGVNWNESKAFSQITAEGGYHLVPCSETHLVFLATRD